MYHYWKSRCKIPLIVERLFAVGRQIHGDYTSIHQTRWVCRPGALCRPLRVDNWKTNVSLRKDVHDFTIPSELLRNITESVEKINVHYRNTEGKELSPHLLGQIEEDELDTVKHMYDNLNSNSLSPSLLEMSVFAIRHRLRFLRDGIDHSCELFLFKIVVHPSRPFVLITKTSRSAHIQLIQNKHIKVKNCKWLWNIFLFHFVPLKTDLSVNLEPSRSALTTEYGY